MLTANVRLCIHDSHTYESRIRVGEDQDDYVRVCAYPDEKTSYRLSWLNIWQVRQKYLNSHLLKYSMSYSALLSLLTVPLAKLGI